MPVKKKLATLSIFSNSVFEPGFITDFKISEGGSVLNVASSSHERFRHS